MERMVDGGSKIVAATKIESRVKFVNLGIRAPSAVVVLLRRFFVLLSFNINVLLTRKMVDLKAVMIIIVADSHSMREWLDETS